MSVCLSVCECLCEERIYLSLWTVLYTRHAARLQRVNFASIPICVFADEFYDKTGTQFHNLPLSSSLIFRRGNSNKYAQHLFLGVLNKMFLNLSNNPSILQWAMDLFRLNCRYNEFSRYIECRYKEG